VTVEAGSSIWCGSGEKYGTSMLFISHNLGLVMEVCDRICVMYSGEAVETGAIRDVFDKMRHPYTQALFRSIPLPGADKTDTPLRAIPGNFPCRMNAPRAAISARAATISSRALRCADIPWPVPAMTAMKAAACAWKRSTGTHWPRSPRRGRGRIGRCVLRMDDVRKYYEVAASSLFSGGDPRWSRPTRP
jgi:peptide/nickel transport system ATP-binding protein